MNLKKSICKPPTVLTCLVPKIKSYTYILSPVLEFVFSLRCNSESQTPSNVSSTFYLKKRLNVTEERRLRVESE